MRYTLGIDLGGTNIAAGVVDETGSILVKGSVPANTPRPPEEICDDMAELCRALLAQAGLTRDRIARAGIGSPGIIWDGVVCYANNLDLHYAPLAPLLQERLELPVSLHGDGNTAAYAEYLLGAGRGCHSLVMLTIGTGIGGGIVLDGKVQSGFNGAAPELGHVPIHPGERRCTCGNAGCFEAYCSASGLIQTTRQAMDAHRDSALWSLCGGNPDAVDGRTAFDGMRQGDAAAAAVVDAFLDDLAIGVSGVVNLLQPEVLCIGGGVSKEGDTILLPLRKRVASLTFVGRTGLRTRLTAAQFGNDAGIIGAALLGG